METTVVDKKNCFQFKTSFSPCTILQLTRYDLSALEKELNKTIQQAPNFFVGCPIIIDLSLVKNRDDIEFLKLKEILTANGIVPVGVRGGSEEQFQAAATIGLPMLSMGKSIALQNNDEKKKSNEPVSTTKLVSHPIRSGTQVYAKDGDLIIVAQVSPGAELLADGHIHVYGTLRGRAMAGAQGNTNARIFCHKLEAELISIAGYYLTQEELQKIHTNDEMIQIYLDGEQLKIDAIS